MRCVGVLGAMVVGTLVLGCGESQSDDASCSGSGGNCGALGGRGPGSAGSGGGVLGGAPGAGGPGAGTAGTASGAGGGGAAGGAAGSAAAPSLDCSGDFGAPLPVLDVGQSGLGSLIISADELELIYELTSAGDRSRSFHRTVRASKEAAFPDGEALSSLDEACGDSSLIRSGDLSADGLRLYFVCYASFDSPPTSLRLARRASSTDPFVVDPTAQGAVGSGPTISSDERSLVTSPSTVADTPVMHRRATTTAAFDAGVPLTGLEGVITPDFSSDDRLLYGSLYLDSSPTTLVVSARTPADSFGPPVLAYADPDTARTLGSVAVSADCRSLYYVEITQPGVPDQRVMVLKR